MIGPNGTIKARFEVWTHTDQLTELEYYNIWDNYELVEIPVDGDSYRRDGYTRNRSYADQVCTEMNAFSDSPNLVYSQHWD